MSIIKRIAVASMLLVAVIALPASATDKPVKTKAPAKPVAACSAARVTAEQALLAHNAATQCLTGQCFINGKCRACP